MNRLYYGDNLEVLRKYVADESVDLVYLDPPFNSNRSYNVIFNRQAGNSHVDASAQIEAFDDTWHWSPVTDQQYHRYALAGELPEQVGEALRAFRILLGENDALAYLVNMAPRLVQLHRVLKPTGSLYLHCDPTMSHYLKVLLDSIFGARFFRNEIVWKRSTTVKGNFGQGSKIYGNQTDVLLFYTKSDVYTFNQRFKPYSQEYMDTAYRYVEPETGRRYRLVSMIGPGGAAKGNPYYEVMGVSRYWRYSKAKMQELIDAGLVVQSKPGTVPNRKYYLDEGQGVPVQSLWDDIGNLQAASKESLGYPTQKPVALLERVLLTSTNEGDVVLDPFCGCGTTVDAAQHLDLQWIGIDITFIAIDLIEKRLQDRYPGISGTFETFGIPRDIEGAKALMKHSPFDFERWAVSRINARPNEKQVGDKGIDGVARFYLDKKTTGRVLVSVKGGVNLGPAMVRDLVGTVETQKAQMGVLITLEAPTPGMRDAANHGGTYTWPINGQTFPRVQIITVADLLAGKRANIPAAITPYSTAVKAPAQVEQLDMLDLGNLASGTG